MHDPDGSALRDLRETLMPLSLNMLMLQRNNLLMGEGGEEGRREHTKWMEGLTSKTKEPPSYFREC